MPAGSLTLWRWHARSCPHRRKGRRWTRCKCGIWVQGSLGGEWIKRSLNTREWSAAAAIVHGWEAAGQVGIVKPDIPRVEDAVAGYFEDAIARHLAETTIRKRRELLEGKLLPFCKAKGFHLLKQLDVNALRTFRNSWPYSPLSAVKRLEYLRGFLRFCLESGWIDSNPATALKAPKVTQRPTLPFEDADVERILTAADQISDWGTFGPKARAMVLLLRYSGLRMQDAACLERTRLKDGKLFLYTQKTGTPVNCPLPPVAVSALSSLSNAHPDYFFWDGRSERETTVKSWNRVFKKIFRSAEPAIEGGHPHRFRDTFAVSLLLKGVELNHVSILLGHASTKITERHYAPWVKARQEQLEADVQRTWGQVPPAPPAPEPAGRDARRRTAGRAARDNAASPAVA
ncbi:MAG TPA: tyrosine-type recombinase/integrase [Vicinamibacterales bacterium]|nr:tyrosine-type recombinase/integrase [Vicinamibacterales bacterium]